MEDISMAQGKFSHPRPHRDEERQIEQAFRQVTGQEPARPIHSAFPQDIPPQDTDAPDIRDLLPEEELPSEEAALFRGEAPFDRGETFDGDGGAFERKSDPDAPAKSGPAQWLDRAMDVFYQNKKMVLTLLCAAALVLIVSVVAIFLATNADPYDGKILDNVFIAGVDVGGMNKSQAVNAVKQATSQTYAVQDMVVQIGTATLRLSPGDTGVSLDVKAAVDAAYAYGRTGTKAEQERAYTASRTEPHTIALTPYLELDKDYIRQTLTSYAGDSGNTLVQTTYGLEGEEPELQTDKFREDAPTQTLVVTMGTPGIGFDANSVYDQVLEAYGQHQFLVTVENVRTVKEPDPLDLNAIYDEYYIAPVDATVDLQTYKVLPGSYGYEFDLTSARKLLDGAEYGAVIRIPMRYIQPEILDDNALFRDVLGEYQTKHTSNENRNTNLRLACQALDGLILNPGETFSYNNTLGERTAAKGYKPAPAYSGIETVDSIGGGICQGSSTLYYCALLADLDIVSRINHGFVPSYIPYGLDATVSWGSPDFQFRNNTNFPIKLQAEVSGGYVRMKILGTEERNYYVKMEYQITATQEPEIEYQDFDADNAQGYKDGDVIREGTTGYTVKTYMLKYDRQTNALISRDFEANSQYKMVSRIVARVAPPVETTEATEPPTDPVVPPADPDPGPVDPVDPVDPVNPVNPVDPDPDPDPAPEPDAPDPDPVVPSESEDGGQQPDTP